LAEQELELTSESSAPAELSELRLAELELDSQERMFCYEYLTDYNPVRAAVDVGRAGSAGRKFLRTPKIARFIRLLSDELIADSLITRDMVQYELLHEYLPRARGDVAINGVDRDGIEFEGKVTNMAAYGKALDMMSKHSGFTVPEVVAGGLSININFDKLGVNDATPVIEGEFSEQAVPSKENPEVGG
jgi:hypothetical protein